MVITRDDGVSGATRISEAFFTALLADRGSPAAPDGAIGYRVIAAAAIDPLFALAIFWHESRFATDPASVNVRYGNRNPGNLRNPPPGAPTIDTDRGRFLTFTSWWQGFAGLALHLASPLYRGLTIGAAIAKYAPAGDGNDPDAYTLDLLAFMNAHADMGGIAPMKRIIISAGHENIGLITAERIGQESADRLRHATGAAGEMDFNRQWATFLMIELAKRGYQAVRTDAIYHADIYGPADLCIAGHYDGAMSQGAPQHAMGAAVLSGNETMDADAIAERFAGVWWTLYHARTGYVQGPITDDMTGYYGGWYRTADTPMVILEHCLGADAGGIRPDHITAHDAAMIDADAIDAFFLPPPASFVQPDNPYGAIPILPPIWNRFNLLEETRAGLGYAMMGWAILPEDGSRTQQFERGRYQVTGDSDPWDVVCLFDSPHMPAASVPEEAKADPNPPLSTDEIAAIRRLIALSPEEAAHAVTEGEIRLSDSPEHRASDPNGT